MTKTLLSFGHGYSAQALAALLVPQGWRVVGTTRSPEKQQALSKTGIEVVLWPGTDLSALLAEHPHVLISAGPGAMGDPVLAAMADQITAVAAELPWVGYLSTTGVYGDHSGAWVDEGTSLTPATKRGQARVTAEAAWQAIPQLPLHIFRLAGIYGPGRGPFAKVRNGTARRIIKEGQVFSRIHVEDIATAVALSIAQPNAGAIYNLCDDDPAPPQDVIGHAADLLGLPLPPAMDYATAEMTPMARSFYAESKKVSNARAKADLGWEPAYPNYRVGLADLLARGSQE